MRLVPAFFAVVFLAGAAVPAFAQREAAFVQPGGASTAVVAKRESDEIISGTPRTIDAGETIVGITKRVTLFFTNFGSKETVFSNITLTADSNVRAEIVQNDCTGVDKLAPNDKCAMNLEVTPNSPGKWMAEIVAIHDAPGRVSRIVVNGDTAGEVGGVGQQPGLSLIGANKDQQIDFGEIESGYARSVRSVLLANDSPNKMSIEQIELVAPENGLSVSEDGCKPGQEVLPGASCPVTVIWQPEGRGEISTDLIIRHTGPVGFAVIPVRGKATGADIAGRGNAGGEGGKRGAGGNAGGKSAAANEQAAMEAAASLPMDTPVPSIASAAVFAKASGNKKAAVVEEPDLSPASLTLRGTSGNSAIIADSSGNVMVVAMGETFNADGANVKVISVSPSTVKISSGNHESTLTMANPALGNINNLNKMPSSTIERGRGSDSGSSGSSDKSSKSSSKSDKSDSEKKSN